MVLMSNLKNLRKMKKIMFLGALVFAGLFMVSCSKEMEAPVPESQDGTGTVLYTIKAVYAEDDGVRTSYADNKTFSWVEGDRVYVRCISADRAYWGWRTFTAQSGGPVTTLTAEIEDGWRPYDVAVYQAYREISSTRYNDSNVRISMPISYHQDGYGMNAEQGLPNYNATPVPSGDPLSVVPLVGTFQSDGSLQFRTGVGVLKVNLTGVDPAADHVRINASEGCLANYLMVKDGEIRMSEPFYNDQGERRATHYIDYYFPPVSDGNVSFHIPLPVGTLPAGSTIALMDAGGNTLFSQPTKKDIVIARNKIVELAPLHTKVEWKNLGTGRFVDNYLWKVMGADAGTYVEVDIWKNMSQAGNYRVVNPYGTAAATFGYFHPYPVAGPQDLDLHILSVGEPVYDTRATLPDQVYYQETFTGIDAPDSYLSDTVVGSMLEYSLMFPGYYTALSAEADWGRNLVARYGAEGDPSVVILAPIYRWAGNYWTGGRPLHQTNSLIQILFPGTTVPVDLDSSVSFAGMADETPEQAVARVSVDLGGDVTSARVVIAADLAAAKAAIAAGENVTVADSDGSFNVPLPAGALSGNYTVFALTQPGAGFTETACQYIHSEPFRYVNQAEDKGFTVDDIVGDFSANTFLNNFYDGTAWGWHDGETFSVRIEKSDREDLGNVMITRVGLYRGTYYLSPNSTSVSNIYGYFNTRLGDVSFPGRQPFYDWQSDASGTGPFVILTGPTNDSDVNFVMIAPGQLSTVADEYYLRSYQTDGTVGGYYQAFNGNKQEIVMTRAAAGD